jgi:hypothetical protein
MVRAIHRRTAGHEAQRDWPPGQLAARWSLGAGFGSSPALLPRLRSPRPRSRGECPGLRPVSERIHLAHLSRERGNKGLATYN